MLNNPERLYELHHAIYHDAQLFGVDRPLPADPLRAAPPARPNSIAVAGGAFGDEGKGRIVDELCSLLARRGQPPLVYRWNGGANAGHTVIVNGNRVALHQLPSGALHPQAVSILGRGMVIHPGDLLEELRRIAPFVTREAVESEMGLVIDAQAVLSLDTHRAFESALYDWAEGGRGSTGRGISPAYADVILRHPVRMRDLMADDWQERLGRHYDLYGALVGGLGQIVAEMVVPTMNGKIQVGTRAEFLRRLAPAHDLLRWAVRDVYAELRDHWQRGERAFIFEGAQAVGLDARFGVYPDITGSDPTFGGILHSTEGLIAPEQIAVRAGAFKATYTSSVGVRRLPTLMDEALANRIREDAHEYGATTRRPRDIAYIDIPCLGYFAQVSGMTHLILTHLDIAYTDTPIRVCTHYTDSAGHIAPYRPDQDYLNTVTPRYIDLPSWNGPAIRGARSLADLPGPALQYIAFITGAFGVPPIMATTGPERAALISWIPES